eukprot:3231512-Amphidinium_carterae.1
MESLGTADMSSLGENPSLRDVMVRAKLNDEQVRSLCCLLELEYDTLSSEPPSLIAMVDSEAFGAMLVEWRLPATTDGGEERAPSQIVLARVRLAACLTLASKSKPGAPASS